LGAKVNYFRIFILLITILTVTNCSKNSDQPIAAVKSLEDIVSENDSRLVKDVRKGSLTFTIQKSSSIDYVNYSSSWFAQNGEVVHKTDVSLNTLCGVHFPDKIKDAEEFVALKSEDEYRSIGNANGFKTNIFVTKSDDVSTLNSDEDEFRVWCWTSSSSNLTLGQVQKAFGKMLILKVKNR
jgi:hypothetical protein